MIDILDAQKNESLLSDFIQENQKLVYSLLCKQFPSIYYSDNRDDMIQEALIYMTKNIRSYDPSKGSIGTYLSKGIILGAYNYVSHQRKYIKIKYVSMNTPINEEEDVLECVLASPEDICDIICEKVDTISKFNSFFNSLVPRDKTLLKFKAQHKTQREIASLLGVSQAIVNRNINRLYKAYVQYDITQNKIVERRKNNMDCYNGKVYVLNDLKLNKSEAVDLLMQQGFTKVEADEYLLLLRKDRNLKSVI